MIPFASQRGLGQDLATHLLNAQDNEYLEVAEVAGAVAEDLHGAFAEWEAQAHALTKCKNYLYSLSVNPDPAQGLLSRAQYFEYIDQVEAKLGLAGQPRVVVFHIKYDREHCHVVWSRVDIHQEKAIQLAFDREKLMIVTRQFAREQGLELPEGYFKDGKGQQLSLYEMQQQRETGLSKEERMEQVTDAWRQSDTPKAFMQALAQQGYLLATGRRPYVLVDFYGNMNALPRLIDDKTVRTKDIRAFLDKEYPQESLPTVEEAKELIAQHRKAVEGHMKAEKWAEELKQLKQRQEARREKLEAEQSALKQRQESERAELAATQRSERDAHRSAYLSERQGIRQERELKRPTGLAAFLGRVTGVELLRDKLHRYQDGRRLQAHLEEKDVLKESQDQQYSELQRRQEMLALDLQRKAHALEQVEKREQSALEESLRREARVQMRRGRSEMPPLALNLTPRGRPAVPHKAMNRYTSELVREQFRAAETAMNEAEKIDLARDFSRACSENQTEGEEGVPSGVLKFTLNSDGYSRERRRQQGRNKGREP